MLQKITAGMIPKKMTNKVRKFVKKLRPHTSNIFWSNVNECVLKLSALIISIVFARLASKELLGQYLYVIAIFSLFSIVSIPGVATAIFRTAAQGYEGVYRKATLFSFLWSLLGIPLIVITGVLVFIFKTKILGISLIICALFFPLTTTFRNWMFFLKGKSDFRKLAVYNLMKLSINVIAIAAAIIFTQKLLFIIVTYFLVNSVFNIAYSYKSLSLVENNKVDQGWKRQSYALTIMTLSGVIFGKIDIILIGFLLPYSHVAVYGLVMNFVDAFFKLIKGTVEAILPELFKSKKITVKYFYKFFLLSFLVPIILYPVIKYPILFIYSQKYIEVIGLSQVYLAVIPFYFLNLIATYFMIKYKLDHEINLSRIISIIAVIALYAILIPLYGIWGGVISSMLYFIIQLTINLFLLKIRGLNKVKFCERATIFM